MTHRVSQLGERSIILVELSDPFDGTEAPQINQEVLTLMAGMTLPAFRLMDFTHCAMAWEQMQIGFATQIKGVPGSMTDPNLIPVCVATSGGAQQAAMQGFAAPEFGGRTVACFETRDQALDYIFALLDERG